MGKPRTHLDTLAFRGDGSLMVGASCLTTRYWAGSLLYFNECDPDVIVDECQVTADLESGVTDMAWISETQRIVVACDSGSVEIWELSKECDSLGCVGRAVEHDSIVTTVSVNSSATKFISADSNGSLKVWDVDEFVPISIYQAHSDVIWCAAFHSSSPDILSTCSQDGKTLVWDLRQSKPARILEKTFIPSSPSSIAWQPGVDHCLAIGTESGLVAVQDCRVGVGVPVINNLHTRLVQRIAFSPQQANWLASASNDCTSAVTAFSRTESNTLCRHTSHRDFVQDVAWNPVTNSVYTCSWDGTVSSHKVDNVVGEINTLIQN